MAAYCTDSQSAIGAPGDVHATQLNDLGAVRQFSNGNFYIYLKGVTSCAVGSTVVFQPGFFAATLIATGVKGQVAIATGAVDASTKFGWFTYIGTDAGITRSAVLSNTPLFAGGVAGSLDDAGVKGDQVLGMYSKNTGAVDGGSVILVFDRACIGFSNESTG